MEQQRVASIFASTACDHRHILVVAPLMTQRILLVACGKLVASAIFTFKSNDSLRSSTASSLRSIEALKWAKLLYAFSSPCSSPVSSHRVAPKEQNALGYQARVCRLTAAKRIAEEVMQHLTCCERGHCLGLDISSNLLSRFSCLETG